ncbi:MAG: leucine-rich repeat domain-containing protein [Bacteroidaceae bacterium]|nr:leucine-rich repeat domain-containing protein [Bacteroidaceae bacterium]
MKKFVSFIFMALLPMLANAYFWESYPGYDAKIDGVCYKFSGESAMVSYEWRIVSEDGESYESEYSGSVVIPESVTYEGKTYRVTSIGGCAFYDCTGLTSITLPGSLTCIYNNAFEGCSGLNTITIPSNVTVLYDAAFKGCKALTSITIPNSVTSIGAYVFSGCTNLTSIVTPETVTYIGSGAFEDTPWYDALPEGLIYIGKVAYRYKGNMPSDSRVKIKEGTVEIATNAFYGYTNLTSITTPNSLNNIRSNAFENCSGLNSITLSEGAKLIDNKAFSGCPELKEIYCYATQPPTIVVSALDGVNVSSATLYVPEESIDLYKATIPWSRFGNIVAMQEEPHQPQSFLEGNPIWVYKYERLTRGNGLKDGEYYGVHVDTGNRKYSYYFLGGQEEIEGKVYTMMGEVKSDGEGELAVSRWLPVREENGIVYAFTDSLPGLIGYDYLEVPYLQVGKECVLYNFNTEIGESLYPQNEYTKVVSYGTYQLMNGAVCRVLKTTIEDFDLYEKLGYLHDCLSYGVMDPPSELIYPTGGDVRATHLNAYYQNGIMLYKAPEIQEGICVNDTCWSRDDGNAYVRSYKVDPRQEEVFSYIRQLQKAKASVFFTACQVATIILPITPDASIGKYYRLDRVDDGQIIFEEEFNPQAHIPYIIVPKEDFSIDLNTLDLAGCYQDTISIAGISFIGSYVSETFDYQEGAYIDIIDTTPDCQYNESCVIGALRAYLLVRWDDPYNQGGTRVPPMNKLEIVLHDYGTGVEDVNLNLDVNHALYDLQGRKVANPRKGIYIKDGRKVLLK